MSRFLATIIFFNLTFCNAQMFDFLIPEDKNINKEISIEDRVNIMYDNLELKIKELVLWELEQIKQVQSEIEFETKDLPDNKSIEIILKRIAELEISITSKELDLDYWYLEQLNKLNIVSNRNNLKYEFHPKTKIKGRILKMVINNLYANTKITNFDDDVFEFKNNNQLVLDSTSVILRAASGNPVISVLNKVFILTRFSIDYSEDLVFRLKNNYSKYFSLGMVSNARETHLEKLNSY